MTPGRRRRRCARYPRALLAACLLALAGLFHGAAGGGEISPQGIPSRPAAPGVTQEGAGLHPVAGAGRPQRMAPEVSRGAGEAPDPGLAARLLGVGPEPWGALDAPAGVGGGGFAPALAEGDLVPGTEAPPQPQSTPLGHAPPEAPAQTPETPAIRALSDAQRLRILEQRLDGLDQVRQALLNGVESNRRGIADLRASLEGEVRLIDPISLRLDALSGQMQQIDVEIDTHRKRMERNLTRLFETLIGIRQASDELERVRKAHGRIEQIAAKASTVAAAGDANLVLLMSAALCLLVPLGVLTYRGGHAAGAAPAVEGAVVAPAFSAWALPAWLGAAAGFASVGFGIMFGASQGGIAGAPLHFLSSVLAFAPADVDAEVAMLAVRQTLLAAIVGVAVCAVAAGRLSPWGHLFVGLVAGALVYPLFGHWTSAHRLLSDQVGWLLAAGYRDSAAATGLAALVGFAALFLSRGLGPTETGAARPQPGPERADTSAAGALLLLVAWPGVVIAAAFEAPPVPALLLASYLGATAAGLGVLVFAGLFAVHQDWHRRVPGGALAGLIAATGAYADVSVAELLLVGLLAGVSCELLLRRWNTGDKALELALVFAAGGIWGTLAEGLFGSGGFLDVQNLDRVGPQVLGLGVLLLLAAASGLLLALAARHLALLRWQR